MKINLSLKYWLSHKSRAFSVILAVAVAMAALTCTAFLVRGASETNLEGILGTCGLEDFTLLDVDSEMPAKYRNDDRVDRSGVYYRDGKIITSDKTEFVFGAMTEEGAPIYHFPFEVGDYPEKSGEIALPRTLLEALGYPVGVGMTINVDLYDLDNNLIGNRDLTVSGVLKDQSDYYFEPVNRSYYKHTPTLVEHYAPIVFLHHDDLSQNAKTDLMLVSAKSENYFSLKKEFEENNIDHLVGNRIRQIMIISMSDTGETEEEMLESLKYSPHDEYTRTLIPVFTSVTMIVAFTSIFSVISTSLSERRRQLAMLRCIGMTKKKALLMMISETFVMVAIGLTAGFALGVGAYLAVFFVQKNILGMEVYPAFSVHPAVAAVTVSPYVLPLFSCFICGFSAMIIPSLIELHRSPVEGLQNSSGKKRKALFKTQNKTLLVGKISGGILRDLPYYIIVITVVWTGVFGCAYFKSDAESNVKYLKNKLDTELLGVDYLAAREDFFALGNAQLNRHFLGIAPENAEKLAAHPEVERTLKAIEIRSTKVIFERGSLDEETEKTIAPLNTANMSYTNNDDLFNKTLEFQGYAENEVLYNVPTVAVTTDIFDELSKYLVEGEINVDKLRSGEEVLVIKQNNSDLFSVGDTVSMTDVVINDSYVEEFDFQTGGIPEDVEPSFYYNVPDGEGGELVRKGYAFGKRKDFAVKIGGVLKFDDDRASETYEPVSEFFRTVSVVGGRRDFQFICDENALSEWGLPDGNYTKLGVKLIENANVDEFEKAWFEVIRNSPSVKSNSLAKILREIKNKNNASASVFFAIMITVVILGLVGIVNTANLRVRKGLRSYSTVRALGLSKNKLTGIIMRQGVFCAFWGAVSSLIPLTVFDLVGQQARKFIENGGALIMPSENGSFEWKWQHFFPMQIKLWEQPLYFVIPMVFAAVCAVIVISNIIPARWIAKKNITDALRNDDF